MHMDLGLASKEGELHHGRPMACNQTWPKPPSNVDTSSPLHKRKQGAPAALFAAQESQLLLLQEGTPMIVRVDEVTNPLSDLGDHRSIASSLGCQVLFSYKTCPCCSGREAQHA